jgi:hypothetical protein
MRQAGGKIVHSTAPRWLPSPSWGTSRHGQGFPHLPNYSVDALRTLGHHGSPQNTGEKCAMQCAACGAKMLLTGVVLADIATMPGF